jgi:hypothetical protein
MWQLRLFVSDDHRQAPATRHMRVVRLPAVVQDVWQAMPAVDEDKVKRGQAAEVMSH